MYNSAQVDFRLWYNSRSRCYVYLSISLSFTFLIAAVAATYIPKVFTVMLGFCLDSACTDFTMHDIFRKWVALVLNVNVSSYVLCAYHLLQMCVCVCAFAVAFLFAWALWLCLSLTILRLWNGWNVIRLSRTCGTDFQMCKQFGQTIQTPNARGGISASVILEGRWSLTSVKWSGS